MANMTIYQRIGSNQIVSDHDLVIKVVAGDHCPLAAITDPRGSSTSELMPVPQALKVVENEMTLEPDYLELVIIDENNLWQEEWGQLVAHSGRKPAELSVPGQ